MAEGSSDRDQRTEEATPRRREEARKQGQVAYSQEFSSAIALAAGVGALMFAGGPLIEKLGEAVRSSVLSLPSLGREALEPATVVRIVLQLVALVGTALLAVVGPIFIVSALCAYGQVGFAITPEALGFKTNRLDPSANVGKLFSLKTLTKMGVGLLHLIVIGTTCTLILWRELGRFTALTAGDVGPFLVGLGQLALKVATGALCAAVALGVLDLLYQRWQHSRELRMTKQEVKEEHRSAEGDPHVKSKIRQIQREMARRRMMSDVPRSTVVVTNPTHVAVAIAYPRGEDDQPLYAAPKVVAKGLDQVAQKIKQLARDAGVLTYEDVALARALHRRVEIGSEVPEDLYQAVAEVLNYVYRVQGIRKGVA